MANTTRKRSQLGSKREVRPGVWDVAVSVGYKSDGRSKRTVYERVRGTARDAQARIAEIAADMGRYPHLGDGTTLGDYWTHIFHPRCVKRVGSVSGKGMARGTLARYEHVWRKQLEPRWGSVDMAEIKHAPVQAWLYTMSRGNAEAALKLLRTMLRSAWAVDELLDMQPLPKSLDLPGTPPAQAPVWGAAEVMRALPRLEGLPLEAVALVMAGGGLRKEEALALTWAKVRFEQVDVLTHDGDGRPCHVAGTTALVTVDAAYTDADGMKDVKTPRGRRVAVVGEPFAGRLAEIAGEPDARLCDMSSQTLAKHWKSMWDPTPARRSSSRVERGAMLRDGEPVVPFVEIRTLRHAHECMMAQHLSDSENSLLHGHTREISYAHYRRENVSAATAAAFALGSQLMAM